MSLINDALKKAQRVRNEEPVDVAAPVALGAKNRIAKRGSAHSANTTILLGSGAVVLVVLSVVVTVYLVNRTPEPAAKPASALVATVPGKPSGSETTPAAVAPKLDLPVTASATEKAGASTIASLPPAVAAPALTTTEPSPPVIAAASVVVPTPIIAAPPPIAAAKPDERVTVFVESIKVAGVRSSGNESRVLMNERVYRVNDVVERTLGLKLVAVAAGALTFSDPSGATYVKNF